MGTEGEALASARVVKAQGRTSVGGGAQGGGEVLVVLHSGDRDDIEAASELPGFGWRQGLTLPVRVIVWSYRRSRLGMVAVGVAGVGVAWSQGRQ